MLRQMKIPKIINKVSLLKRSKKRGDHLRKYKIIALIIVTHFIFILFPPNNAYGEANKPEIKIDVSPKDSLFDVENMKPGDWAPRTVVVQNNGQMDFDYEVQLQHDGQQKLFNELTLEISDENGELFNGKLADFNSLELRSLAADHKEELEMTVRFPEHLGNEFQGLATNFTLLFIAKGQKGKIDHVSIGGKVGSDTSHKKGGSMIPTTATNMFNLIAIGLLFLVLGGLLVISRKIILIRKHRDHTS